MCAYMWLFWVRQTLTILGIYVAHLPELENLVLHSVLVEEICGCHRIRDIELFSYGYFLWRTLHPGHFQT